MHSDPTVRRVLVYRIGSLGDTIVALPCFHLIERRYPRAERILLTNYPVHVKAPAAAAVLEGSNLIHGYMRYTIGTRSPGELLRLAMEIRRFKPDVLIYLTPVRSSSSVQRDKRFFRFAAGVKHIIGVPDPMPDSPAKTASGLYESEAVRLARCVAELGDAAPEDQASWDLRLTEKERETARKAVADVARGRPLIVCGPGTKMQAKDWGQENWRALLGRLSMNYPTNGLALVGAGEDFEVSEYASRDWCGPKVNLCGRLTPRETAGVLEHGAVFLGPDSGPMHLAACVSTPCVIAFSARGLPGVWYPAGPGHRILYRKVSCQGCNLETCIAEERRCLAAITVEEMSAAVLSVLRERAAGQDPTRLRTVSEIR